MAHMVEGLAASGYRGAPVPLLAFAQREPTEHLAVVLPGATARCESPLLALPTQLLRDAGADVLWVRYEYGWNPDWPAVSSAERRAWVRADMAAIMALALARRRYRRVTVVAKSLGTSVLGHMLEMAPWGDAAVEAIWLTPLTRQEVLRRQVVASPPRSLFVVGDADREHDPAGQDEVLAATGGELLLIPGVGHDLAGADVWRSLRILEQVVGAIAGFLGIGQGKE